MLGNAADVVPRLAASGAPIDIVTDQTSAHDPLSYIPQGLSLEEAAELRASDAAEYTKRAQASMAAHCAGMVASSTRGAEVFDYGNNLRAEAEHGGFDARLRVSRGSSRRYIRPLFCEGKGPFRWAALSGDPADIAATDRAVLEEFPENEALARWIRMAGDRVAFQGLPARICWLGYGERHRLGMRFNDMVARGELRAPIVIGRDHLDAGSVASPYRETESMADGSDAIADWPLLNALRQHRERRLVGEHPSRRRRRDRPIDPRGQVVVVDGTELAGRKAERVLTNDPGTGVLRHVDAGYDEAKAVAAERGVRIPMTEN